MLAKLIVLLVAVSIVSSLTTRRPRPRTTPHTSAVGTQYTTLIDAEFDKVYNGETLPDATLAIYRYNVSQTDIVRVWIRSINAHRRAPVYVSVRHLYGIEAEQLPVLALPYLYNVFAHTLCPYDEHYRRDMARLGRHIDDADDAAHGNHVSVEVSSDVPVGYQLEVTRVESIDVMLANSSELTSSPVQPVYVRIHLPPDTDTVVVKVTSDTDTCMLVSVQPPVCPIHDLLSNVKDASAYQTMSRLSAIPITRTEYVVFVVLNNDEACTLQPMHEYARIDPVSDISRRKRFTVSLETKISYDDYVYAIGLTLGAILLAFVVAFLSAYFIESSEGVAYKEWATQLTRQHRVYRQRIAQHPDQPTSSTPLPTRDRDTYDRRLVGESAHNYGTLHSGEPGAMQTSDEEAERSLDSRVVVMNDRRERRLAHLKSLNVADLAKKSHKTRDTKYRLYLWNILTISLFYALPVVQLVLVWAKQVNKGDQDLCWYNHLCARPLAQIYAFNSVFSNIGYVALGFLFMCLVAYRHLRYRNSSLSHGVPNYGLPQHFGLYYAIGIAIMLEGVLSAAYHICPSPDNYQFDTAFMYMIGVLGILQTYALRHPDINANAHITFALMSAVILTAMAGVYFHGALFWICFGAGYSLLTLLVSLEYYYKGSWSVFDTGDSLERWRVRLAGIAHDDASSVTSDDERPMMSASSANSSLPYQRGTHHHEESSSLSTSIRSSPSGVFGCCRRVKRMVSRSCRMLLPHYPKRFFGVLLGAAANIALMAMGVVRRPGDFPSYLLVVFIMNLILYYTQYLLMKLVNGERLRATPLVMLSMSMFTWAGSIYFFMRHVSDWSLPPAASRAMNSPCMLLNFYDSHDCWHFLSALSLFLSFTSLLKLDDDTRMTPRGALLVF